MFLFFLMVTTWEKYQPTKRGKNISLHIQKYEKLTECWKQEVEIPLEKLHARVSSLTDKFIKCYESILWWSGHPLMILVSLWVLTCVRYESAKMPPGTVMTRAWQNSLSVELSSLKYHIKVTTQDCVFVSKVLRWHGLVPSWGGYLAIPSICLNVVKMWKK